MSRKQAKLKLGVKLFCVCGETLGCGNWSWPLHKGVVLGAALCTFSIRHGKKKELEMILEQQWDERRSEVKPRSEAPTQTGLKETNRSKGNAFLRGRRLCRVWFSCSCVIVDHRAEEKHGPTGPNLPERSSPFFTQFRAVASSRNYICDRRHPSIQTGSDLYINTSWKK